MRNVRVAAIQMACGEDRDSNLARAEEKVIAAAKNGAQIILLQELFETPYFCKDQDPEHFALARPFEGHPALTRMSRLAREYDVVLPISYFERANNNFFNSLAVVDAGGQVLSSYRKTHIPDGPGYQEKYYFTPGDTGFMVWQTKYASIGVGICWDQWFPEAARVMSLSGAELLFYPTAIGNEPQDAALDSKDHWQTVMRGHAAANMVPVIASNRIGKETGKTCELTFYGHSFMTDETGAVIAQAGTEEETLHTEFDLDAIGRKRTAWGLFRDRRPNFYVPLLSYDGQ